MYRTRYTNVYARRVEGETCHTDQGLEVNNHRYGNQIPTVLYCTTAVIFKMPNNWLPASCNIPTGNQDPRLFSTEFSR